MRSSCGESVLETFLFILGGGTWEVEFPIFFFGGCMYSFLSFSRGRTSFLWVRIFLSECFSV